MIRHAILYGAKGDRIYEYYYHPTIKKLVVSQLLHYRDPINWIFTWSMSCYRTIEEAIKDPNDKKRVILKYEEKER